MGLVCGGGGDGVTLANPSHTPTPPHRPSFASNTPHTNLHRHIHPTPIYTTLTHRPSLASHAASPSLATPHSITILQPNPPSIHHPPSPPLVGLQRRICRLL